METSASLNLRGGAFADAALERAWARLGGPSKSPEAPWGTFRETRGALEDFPKAWERLGRPAGRHWGRLGRLWRRLERPSWENLLETTLKDLAECTLLLKRLRLTFF